MMLYGRVMATLALAALTAAPASAAPPVPVQGVGQYVFDRIVHFAKIAQATYAGDGCTIPSLPRLATFLNATTQIYGWILRDDKTRELILSYRGTNATVNHVFDRNWNLSDITPTLPECVGCEVHAGYYEAFLSIYYNQVLPLLQREQRNYPGYKTVVTGHSLGAGLAAITSAHLVPGCENLNTYTFGEPRMGNLAFAHFLDKNFDTCFYETTRYFRTTHANDGIVVVPYLNESYVHQGLELWSSADPATPNNTFVCPSEGFCCEASGVTPGINDAHITYFNVSSGTCSQDV